MKPLLPQPKPLPAQYEIESDAWYAAVAQGLIKPTSDRPK